MLDYNAKPPSDTVSLPRSDLSLYLHHQAVVVAIQFAVREKILSS
jgi:hypothetical protein